MSYNLNASGHIPSNDAAGNPQDTAALELGLYDALKAVLSDPKYGCLSSSFGGSHISGSLHQPDA